MAFVRRDHFEWKLRTRSLALGLRTLVMGVLNVTPDSFSDGNLFLSAEAATEQAVRMFDEGAAIVDIGGESTRPGSGQSVSARQEIDRVLPVIEMILKERPGSVLSIDTYKAETARVAVEAGAEIVNDVSGFLWEPMLAQTCSALRCGVILMHTRGKPDTWKTLPKLLPEQVVFTVKQELAERLDVAIRAGIGRDCIVLDPGYGFGKILENNYPLLAHQDELSELGYPLLAGVSRKSFLGHTLAPINNDNDVPIEGRSNATLAATTAAILAGAHIVRVHDVRSAVEAALIADAILGSV